MKRKKTLKNLCLALAAVFIFTMALTGCGKTDGQTTTETTGSTGSTAQTTAQEAANLDFVTLEWYMGVPTDPRPSEASVMAEINKYLEEKINANLKFNFTDWGTLQDKMNVMIASGEAFDLAMTASWLGFPINVQKDGYFPLDDLLNQYGKNILSEVPENAWSAVSFAGKKYAVINPTVWSNRYGITYKKDLVDKYGFDYKNAHTLKDLGPYLELIKKNEPDITPLCIANVVGVAFGNADNDAIITSRSTSMNHLISYNLTENKLIYWWEDQVILECIRLMNDYYKKGYVRKDAATIKDWVAEWKTGKYAVGGCNGTYDETGAKSSAWAGFPCVESFQAQPPITTGAIQGCLTVIGKNSKNPERAMMLLDLLFGDKKFFNTVCYGIEGQDYKVISGQGTDNPTIETNSPYTWAVFHPWIGSLWDQWPSNWNSAEALDQMKKDSDSGRMSPLLGFVFNTEPVKQELAKIGTLDGELDILSVGMAPDVEKYMADLKQKYIDNGMEKVMAEVQSQVDAWKAANGQ